MADKKTTKDWMKLNGTWKDWELSAEEIIKLIRESRVSKRVIEPLD